MWLGGFRGDAPIESTGFGHRGASCGRLQYLDGNIGGVASGTCSRMAFLSKVACRPNKSPHIGEGELLWPLPRIRSFQPLRLCTLP